MEAPDETAADPKPANEAAEEVSAEKAAPEPSPDDYAAEDAAATAESKLAIQKTARAVLVSAAVLTVASALVFDLQTGASVLVGGVLASVNLLLFARLVRAFLAQRGASAPWGILGALKLVGLFACVYILVRRGGISPIGLGIGYAALPIGITFATLFRPPPAPAARRR